ncbi:hypothetical protein G6011_03395 [Alternaria panax]|uniref:Uncharacterized protein n=1 Tax=Alternaria panax TaxID=48097 RepID=A0AAD4NTZ8_9PLEO|nr:hypothetical protein G6011_03395 [Alternaria panax]
MYYYLQECPRDDDIRSRVRVTASRVQERPEQHGAMMLTGAASGGGDINMQLSAPVSTPAQPRQAQPQMQVQQPSQQAFNQVTFSKQQLMPHSIQQRFMYQQQAPPQQSIFYQPQQQSRLFNVPGPAAIYTLSSAPAQNISIGRIGRPRIAYLGRPRRMRTPGLFHYSDDSD